MGLVLFWTVAGHAESRPVFLALSEWVPMAYEDDRGQPQGLLVEIVREVVEREMGLTLAVKFLPWVRAQKEVEFGQSDVLITVPTEERLAYALASDRPFYRLPLFIYTYKDHLLLPRINQIRTVSDIKSLKLVPVTNLGNGWHREHIDAYGINTHYAAKEANILQLLALKRGDIVIDAAVPTNFLIRKYGLGQKVVQTACRFSQVDFHLLVGRKSPFSDRMQTFNQAFSRAQDRIETVARGYEHL